MTIKKYILAFLNGILLLTVLMLLLNELTYFEIKNQQVKSFIYFGILVLPMLTLTFSLVFLKKTTRKVMGSILPILTLIGIFIIGPKNIIFSSSTWKTQSVLFQDKNLNFKKVEFQMQDVGNFGYNKRTVEVTYLTDFFMIVKPVGEYINEKNEWIKIDEEINELGLKLSLIHI